MINVLLVEDDPAIADVIGFYLSKNQSYQVVRADTLKDALAALPGTDLILLDIMLPETNGIDLCAHFRKQTNCPILFISCLDDEETIVRALQLGGDDYLVKPFSCSVLLAHIEANLRRFHISRTQLPHQLRCGDIELDTSAHTAKKCGMALELSPTEHQILHHMMENRGAIIEPEALYQSIWHKPSLGDLRTISVHISNLRHKLGDDPADPKYIKTVRGLGYRMDEP